MKLYNLIFGEGGFFHYGFWGMALVEYLKYCLIGNAVYTLLIFLRNEIGNTLKKIALGTFVITALCSALMIGRLSAGELFGLSTIIILTAWLWYFIFIPQWLIYFITKGLSTPATKRPRLKAAIWRLLLTFLLPFSLVLIHILIGQFVFNITPD
jgi:hypothetical protein